jgi:hypothetical protein
LTIVGDGAGVAGVWDTNDKASAVGTSVLGEIVAAGEILATLVALKGLVLGVQGTVVTLEVLQATEATRAESADEVPGWIVDKGVGKGLFATAAVDGYRGGPGGIGVDGAVVRAAVGVAALGKLASLGLVVGGLAGIADVTFPGLGLSKVLFGLNLWLGGMVPLEGGEAVGD